MTPPKSSIDKYKSTNGQKPRNCDGTQHLEALCERRANVVPNYKAGWTKTKVASGAEQAQVVMVIHQLARPLVRSQWNGNMLTRECT